MLGKVYVDLARVSTQGPAGLEPKSTISRVLSPVATIGGSGQNKGELRAREDLFTVASAMVSRAQY
jgi:hypothetical protein